MIVLLPDLYTGKPSAVFYSGRAEWHFYAFLSIKLRYTDIHPHTTVKIHCTLSSPVSGDLLRLNV